MERSLWIRIVAEGCLAVIFVRAVWAYARSRNPLHAVVAAVFLPPTVLLVGRLAVVSDVGPQMTGSRALAILVLSMPLLTLWLAAGLGRVPAWAQAAGLVVFTVTTTLVLTEPNRIAYRLGFAAIEVAAAWFFWAEARRRRGATRIRLRLTAVATVALGTGVLAGLSATVRDSSAPLLLILTAALTYVAALAAPRWLQRIWSAGSTQAVTRALSEIPWTDPPEMVWRRYAETVRDVMGTCAVSVVLRTDGGQLTQVAHTVSNETLPSSLGGGDLDALLAEQPPIRLDHLRDPIGVLGRYLAGVTGCSLGHAAAVSVPPNTSGALVILHDRWCMFSQEEVNQLAYLAGQAGILADRAATIGRMSAADKAKSVFLANMSHELRTPLNAIIGFSDLILNDPPHGDHLPAPPDFVRHIHSAGRHLLDLVNDLLDLAKIEAGELDLQPLPLRLDEAAQDVADSLCPLADRKQLRVTVAVPPLEAYADPIRLRQMINNLLSNAIKFTPEGGRITIGGHRIGHKVAVRVTDTGIGIAEEDLPDLFERFRQMGDNRQRQGTGLGLALTRQLVHAHGGDITVESVPGRGTTFTITLPPATPRTARLTDDELQPTRP